MPSRRVDPRWPAGEIVVTARSRFGRLMLIDAEVDGQRVYVIVDTGAQITVGNIALRRALERRHRLGPIAPVELVSVTGGAVHRRIYARPAASGSAAPTSSTCRSPSPTFTRSASSS